MSVSKNESLANFADWDVKTIQLFKYLILSWENTPSSKLFLTSMIKFTEMYRPLKRGPFHFELFDVLDDVNEERAAKQASAYLYRKDLVKIKGERGNKSLVLTTRAHKIFYGEYPLAELRSQKWDGFWTLVAYDLPNIKRGDRDYLRRKLKDLGFGCPQESLYICPLPLASALRELVEGEGMEDFVWVLRAETVLGLPNKEVAKRAWNLDELNGLYIKLLEALPGVGKSGKKNLLEEWQKYYLALDFNDPYLPFELLPDDWQGEVCKKEFSKLGAFGLLKSIFGLR